VTRQDGTSLNEILNALIAGRMRCAGPMSASRPGTAAAALPWNASQSILTRR
jgi:hypothetical protein